MKYGKVIRGKTLGAWKKYAEEEYDNTPVQVQKYIIVLEEELSEFTKPTVIPSCEGNCGMNYCDENGCVANKRIAGELKPPQDCH